MEPAEDAAELFELVTRSSIKHRRELTTVLLGSYRVDLAHALRAVAHRHAPNEPRAPSAELDRVFVLASRIAAAAGAARLPDVCSLALALERSAAAAHLGGPRSDSEVIADGLRVIERILAVAPEPKRYEV